MWCKGNTEGRHIRYFPQPFEKRRHVDLIGFVIPGHSIDHDIDPEANRHLTLLFAAGHDRGERISALIAGPSRRPIIAAHEMGDTPSPPRAATGAEGGFLGSIGGSASTQS